MFRADIIPRLFFLDLEVQRVPSMKGEPTSSITQLAVYDPLRKKGERVFNAYIKPPKELRYQSDKFRYNHSESSIQRRTFKKVWPLLKEWVNGSLDGNRFAVFAAHNAYQHDWPILKQECARIMDAPPPFWRPFCTLALSNTLRIPGDHSLTGLCHTMGVKVLSAHDAYNDTKMLKNVFYKMTEHADMDEVKRAMMDTDHPVIAAATAIKARSAVMLVFFDFETTGLFPKKGDRKDNPRAVELGAYIPETQESFCRLINPECPIPMDAQKIHGISDEDVKNANTFKVVWLEFEDWIHSNMGNTIDKTVCLAGHNIWGYDLPLLRSECERVGINSHYKKIKDRKWKTFDTLALSRHLFKGIKKFSHKLQSLREGMGFEEDHAHRADGDTRVNNKVYQRFIEGVSQTKLNQALQSKHPILSVGQLIRDHGSFDPIAYSQQKSQAPTSTPKTLPADIKEQTPFTLAARNAKRKRDEYENSQASNTFPIVKTAEKSSESPPKKRRKLASVSLETQPEKKAVITVGNRKVTLYVSVENVEEETNRMSDDDE